jgi:hypothetical protein
MPRHKQAAPVRGGRYAAVAPRGGSPAAQPEEDGASSSGGEEAAPQRAHKRRRHDSTADAGAEASRLPLATSLAGARRCGDISVTWPQAGPPEGAPLAALHLCDSDTEDDADADDAARTPFTAHSEGASPPCAGFLCAPRGVARALGVLLRGGAAAAVISRDAGTLRVALLPAAFADAPAAATDGDASAAHAAARAVLPHLLASPAQRDAAARDEHASFDAAALYAALRRAPGGPRLPERLPGLLPALRPYQARAAAWMVSRESDDPSAGDAAAALHPLWQRVGAADDADEAGGSGDAPAEGCFYFCAATGRLSLQAFAPPPQPRGGILADEMARASAA